jgi:putative DNA primase/helicase
MISPLPNQIKCDLSTVRAAMKYYGLPENYTRVFAKLDTSLSPFSPKQAATSDKACWAQVNLPAADFPLKKASNADIITLLNISLDFEYPPDPGKVHQLAAALADRLVELGLAENGLPVEDSGAGAHIVLPVVPVQVEECGGGKLVNDAVSAIVNEFIKPEFDELATFYGLAGLVKLEGFDISRILSMPGSWRPGGSKSNEASHLINGFVRNWLPPFEQDPPQRIESEALSSLIKAFCITLQAEEEDKKLKQTAISTSAGTVQKTNGKHNITPAQWLTNRAASKSNSGDRSADFNALVWACYFKFDAPTVTANVDIIDSLTGGKYGKRAEAEALRSLRKAETLPKISRADWYSSKTEVDPATGEPVQIDLLRFEANDDGNALAFMAVYGKEFLYCEALGWLSWARTHWLIENSEFILREKIIEVLKVRRKAAVDAGIEAIVKTTAPNAARVSSTVTAIQSKVFISVKNFDNEPDLLNCANGILNLKSGELIPHSPEYRLTYCLPVEYDPAADYSAWLTFLETVVDGGPDVLNFLKMAVGYSLTGHTREEILFYLHGPTRGGKGTFCETLAALLEQPLSTEVEFNTFTAPRDGDSNNFDLAPLKPCRLVFASESKRQQSLNPAKVKALTGGNSIYCCFKHRTHFNYRPQFKIWLSSNWPVNGDVDDEALWGRIRVIKFPTSHLGKEDKGLKSRLRQKAALSGILRWAVEGAIAWYKLGNQGLVTPKAVEASTKEQRSSADFVQGWLEECCQVDETSWESNSQLYASYKAWCDSNGVEPKHLRNLTAALASKGYSINILARAGARIGRGVQGLSIM